MVIPSASIGHKPAVESESHYHLNFIMTTCLNSFIWQSKRDKNIKKQTQLYNHTGILDNCKLNCAKVQRSWMLQTQLCKSTKVLDAAISTVQKYKGRGCCQLNCVKVQRSWMLPTQLCKSTKVVNTANSTVQKYKGRACCNLNCAILQGYWITANSAAQKYKH